MTDHAIEHVGPRLKSWRQKRNLTIAELSATTGISASTISRLEAGKRAPNLELVVPIARALRLELDDIIPLPAPDPRVAPVTKRIDGRTFITLSPESAPMQTVKATIPATPPGSVAPPELRVHDGYEWLYVLSGQLRLVLGEHDIVMGVGEAAEFDTRTPHWLAAAGRSPVELLMIFSREGKRIHLRAKPAAPVGG
jgi:transcriptional regulator with XRE-family HTH domain